MKLSRRTFLRGAAAGATVALALPPLEAMFLDNGARADGLRSLPFFGVFYWANGLPWTPKHGAEQANANHPDVWTPVDTGQGFTHSPLLAPLEAHQVNVATGYQPATMVPSQPPGQADGHMRGFMVALTGDRPRAMGFNHPAHALTARRPSLDQYVARHPDFYDPQEMPRYRSLEVGVSSARFHNYGHWNAISYNGPDSLNLPIMDTGALYDRLFSVPTDSGSQQRRVRLLDAVLEDARDLRSKLGARDRQRVEAHLEHLNSLQRGLETATAACQVPGRPASGGDLIARTRVVGQLLALAINCDLTRVFSFMLTSPASTHVFNNLGVPDGMHKTCHDGHWERVRAITEYQMQAFAAFLDALDVPSPTGGTLLDDGVVFGISEYGEGWKHSVREMPVVIAGGGSGRLRRGVHTRTPNGNICEAHVTVLRGLGLETPSFGFSGAETGSAIPGFLT